ncbi:MAG: flagellar basal body-associated protein FliL [Gammaproteobacteria bacterium]|nr:flagellar basal body-associated protein FliL [Gammaproteobacteria bacterium]
MADSKTGSSKLLWVMIVLVVLSLITAGVAAYLAWQSDIGGTDGDQAAEQTVREPPIFVELEPFTINLSSSTGSSRLLYIGITFKVGNQQTKAILEEYLPQVRSRLLMKLSDEQVDELTTAAGKEELAGRLVSTLRSPPLADDQPELVIDEVLFTEFIVQ